jgi:hypothetical protein
VSDSTVGQLVLPNFFIIGAAKCGTTSLYDLLRLHPQIFLPSVKEPQFFSHDDLFAEGIERYARHFARSGGYPARGEATPHYLLHAKAAERIARLIPEAGHRFIAIFRDPVQRAYSLYWNLVAEGVESLPFREALEREPDRIRDPALEREGSLACRYVAGGLYARQLRTWFDRFPRERFCLLFQDDLQRDQAGVLAEVFRFLAVSPNAAAPTSLKSNPSFQPRFRALQTFLRRPHWLKEPLKRVLPEAARRRLSEAVLAWNRRSFRYPPIDPDDERWLRERFAGDVRELMEITGRDLGAWLPR